MIFCFSWFSQIINTCILLKSIWQERCDNGLSNDISYTSKKVNNMLRINGSAAKLTQQKGSVGSSSHAEVGAPNVLRYFYTRALSFFAIQIEGATFK